MDIKEVVIYLKALQEVSDDLSFTKLSERQDLGIPLYVASISLTKEVDGVQKMFCTTALFFGDDKATLHMAIRDNDGLRVETVGRNPADLEHDESREFYNDDGTPNWSGACMFLHMSAFANAEGSLEDEMEERLQDAVDRLCAEQ